VKYAVLLGTFIFTSCDKFHGQAKITRTNGEKAINEGSKKSNDK
jgi:hypothetical protein